MKTTKQSVNASTILICAGLLLSTIFGGYIVTDETQLRAGLGELLANVFGGPDAPLFAHAVLGLPFVVALVAIVLRRRVLQVPNQVLSAVWLLFFLLVGGSTLFSSFKMLSLELWFEWLLYAFAFFAVVAAVGRRHGPALIQASIVGGCAIVAAKGILEYGEWRAVDPSWRIFAGWVNPNATAALLLMGFFVAIGLCLGRSRMESLLSGMAAALIAFAIFLTGSKGAVALGLPVGTIAFACASVRPAGKGSITGLVGIALVAAAAIGALFLTSGGWLGLLVSVVLGCVILLVFPGTAARSARAGRFAACYVSALILVLLLALTSPGQAGGSTGKPGAPAIATPIARVSSGAQTETQSAEFRLNLWRSALHLVKERPLTGYGLGSYRYESGRAGITTTTLFAHNVYLHLWAEVGIAPLALLCWGVLFWLWTVFRGMRNLPPANTAPVAGIVAAVVGLLAHSLVDSDLYYFGIGIVFFSLLGVGLLLSVDSVAPEYVPLPMRALVAACAAVLTLLLFGAAYANDSEALVRGDMATGADPDALRSDIGSLEWLAGVDGEADYLLAGAKTGQEQVAALQDAYRLAPSERNARMLARVQAANGNPVGAISTLKLALVRDPSNLLTLNTLMRLQLESGDRDASIATAQRLVAVEKSPYFTVRSIPESVPTETYLARIDVLAPNESDRKRRADLLAEAVRGMLEYARVTAGRVAGFGKDHSPDFRAPGYDSVNEARAKLGEAQRAAQEAAAVYRGLGDETAAREMETDEPVFRDALPASSAK